MMSRLAPITAAQIPLRPLSFAAMSVTTERRGDGTIYVRPTARLADYPTRITDCLVDWAAHAPDRVFMAERDLCGGWRTISYAQMLQAARRIASALLARPLSAERPVMMLSGNSLAHAQLAFGALYAGIPHVPVSPQYSLLSTDFAKLGDAIALLTPGLVFVEDASLFAAALQARVPPDVEIVTSRGAISGRKLTAFDELLATTLRADLEAHHAAITPDHIARFLLTSGSTGNPKAVINTQRMLCANQMMLRQAMTFLGEQPPVIVDWLPWSHTFGSNHNIGLTLFNGGSMYLDNGKPTPAGIGDTIRNLREIAPTLYFNVPKGFEALLPALRQDAGLRRTFFSRLQALFFAGASLSAHVWNGLDQVALAQTGARVPMLTGFGSTETAPFFMAVTPLSSRSGHVGLPAAGNEAKLVPCNGKLEVRVRGPNVTPGYWRQPELTARAFDEEGYYKLGDALRPADPEDLSAGYDFDGRLSEDFKLASGTWVSIGPLRARFIAACTPLVRDVVIAGLDRDQISALVLLDLDGCRQINPALPPDDLAASAADAKVRAAFRQRFASFLTQATGSSNRITRAILLDEPLSIDKGEVTDKGTVNQRAVRDHRSQLIADLYADAPPKYVIVLT
jgi:feruloyl-CoA synthase